MVLDDKRNLRGAPVDRPHVGITPPACRSAVHEAADADKLNPLEPVRMNICRQVHSCGVASNS